MTISEEYKQVNNASRLNPGGDVSLESVMKVFYCQGQVSDDHKHEPEPGRSIRVGCYVCTRCDRPILLKKTPSSCMQELVQADAGEMVVNSPATGGVISVPVKIHGEDGCELHVPLPPLEKFPERIDMKDPRFSSEMKQRHENRYRWARDVIRERFVRAGAVIDFACGTGYGSAILREVADKVYGRDKSAAAIKIATERHGSTAVNFAARPVTFHGAEQVHLFDAIVTIETIEHLADDELQRFLGHAWNLLIPGGLLIVSTPEAASIEAGAKPENPYHLREYTRGGLAKLLEDNGFVVGKYDDWMPGFLCMVARRPA